MSGTPTGVVNFPNFTFSALLSQVFGSILRAAAARAGSMSLEHSRGAGRRERESKVMAERNRITVDGSEAAASVACRPSEAMAIYPITRHPHRLRPHAERPPLPDSGPRRLRARPLQETVR
jgi:hypothetical protein